MLKAQVLEPAPATYQERRASSSLLRSSLLSMLALSAVGMMAYNLVPIAEPWGVEPSSGEDSVGIETPTLRDVVLLFGKRVVGVNCILRN